LKEHAMTSTVQRRQEAQILEQFSLQAAPLAADRGGTGDESINRLLTATKVTSDDIVLDVACGTGQVVSAFAEVAQHVTGIDLTPAMIDQAKARQAQLHLGNVSWIVGDACDLPFADASFSIVTCRYVLHHMLNPSRVVAEMTRVCASGGRVCFVDVITTLDRAEAYDGFERLRDPSHVRALTFEELIELATANHLEQLTHSFYDFEIELEVLLNGSFPDGDRKQDLRELIVRNLDRNDLGVRTYRNESGIVVGYPIAIVSARRT
jgi:ubiquinone/menaquinone biosynthesis C-methylase UbiE